MSAPNRLLDEDAFQIALDAYKNSIYGAIQVKLAEAIEAYLKTPSDQCMADSVKILMDNLAAENERLREALEYIAGSLRNSGTDETLLAIRNVCDTALEQSNKDTSHE